MATDMRITSQFVSEDLIGQAMNKLLKQQEQLKQGSVNINKEADKYPNILEKSIGTMTMLAGKAMIWVSVIKQAIGFMKEGWDFLKGMAEAQDSLNRKMAMFGDNMQQYQKYVDASAGLLTSGQILKSKLAFDELGASAGQYAEILNRALAYSNKMGGSVEEWTEKIQAAITGQTRGWKQQTGMVLEYERAYKKIADDRGIEVSALSESEKAHARINTFIQQTADSTHLWAQKMSEVNKMEADALALAKIWKEIKASIYDFITPDMPMLFKDITKEVLALTPGATQWAAAMKDVNQYIEYIGKGKYSLEEVHEQINQMSEALARTIQIHAQKGEVDRFRDAIEQNMATIILYGKALQEFDTKYIASLSAEAYATLGLEEAAEKTRKGKKKKGGEPEWKKRWELWKDTLEIKKTADDMAVEMAGAFNEATLSVGDLVAQNLADSSSRIMAGGFKQFVEAGGPAIVDTMATFVDEFGIITDPLYEQMQNLAIAGEAMWDAWGKNAGDALAKTQGFIGGLAKIHKAFAIFMAPFEYAEAYRAFATFQYLQGIQHTISAGWYTKVGASGIASLFSGGSAGAPETGAQMRTGGAYETPVKQPPPGPREIHLHIGLVQGSPNEQVVQLDNLLREHQERGLTGYA